MVGTAIPHDHKVMQVAVENVALDRIDSGDLLLVRLLQIGIQLCQRPK